MRPTHALPPLLDFTGLCYGRSPPSGAGREAAEHTSRNSSHSGADPPPMPLRILRAVPKTFANGTIYVMRASAQTTFMLATLTMTLTTMGQFLQSLERKNQIWKSSAATKTDELSGVLTEDKDQNPLVQDALTLGSNSRGSPDKFFANGNPP